MFKSTTIKAETYYQQEIVVSGTITDQAGPLPGVFVSLKSNPSLGTQTDVNGKYTLKVPANGTLVFNYIGYTKQEVDIKGESVVNVELKSANTELNQVTVVAYGVQKKESVVGAISTVNTKELKVPVRSLANALGGRIAGVVSVQRSGEPGNDDATIQVRGSSTFGASNAPLVLVDGIERGINNIEPEEIETFSVLKDASATAMYGIRGANGVILVTTKRGSNGKPSINLKIESGIAGATSLPKLADAATVYELYNEANLNSNPDFSTPYTPDIIQKYRDKVDPEVYPDVDWINLMMKDWTNNQRVNLNVAGGGDVAKYFVSATYYDENGIWKGDNANEYNINVNLKRYNFRANTDINLHKNTLLSIGLGGVLITQNYPGRSSDAIWDVIMRTNPGDYLPTYTDANGNTVFGGSGNEAIRSPYADLVNTGYQTTWNNTLQSDIRLKQEIPFVKGLKLLGTFSFDADNYHNIQRTRNFGDMYRAAGRDADGNLILNRYTDGQEDLGFGKQAGGNRRIYMQANVNYDRTFGKHTVGGLLLYNQQDYVNANAGSSIYALPYRYQGLVTRVTYGYKSKYFAEFNAGYNGSENFEKGERFGLFPSFGVSWIASEEKFIKNNLSFIQYLKLRGSYGSKGNDQLGGRRFAYLTTVGGGNGGFIFGYGNNWYSGRAEDELGADLTWEREQEINLGLEIQFLRSFSFNADVFRRHRSGIFMQRLSLPDIMGLNKAPWGNIGEMDNRGLDATLEYRKRLGEFNLFLKGTLTYTKNKIIENDEPDRLNAYQSTKGQRLWQPFGLIAERLYTDEDFNDKASLKAGIPEPKFGNQVKPGDIKYIDVNGDGLLDATDQVAIGNPSYPSIIYGFMPNLQYKSFDLSVFFQGTGNMDFMLGGTGIYPFLESLGRATVPEYATDRWTVDNPNQDVMYPRLSYGDNPNNYQPSTWWLKNASYLRLKSVELGYTLPQRLTTKLKINNLRLYAIGFNVMTWSKFKLWDPELGSGNGARYPIQKNFSFGISMNF